MPGQQSFIGNKHPGFCMDKYSTCSIHAVVIKASLISCSYTHKAKYVIAIYLSYMLSSVLKHNLLYVNVLTFV